MSAKQMVMKEMVFNIERQKVATKICECVQMIKNHKFQNKLFNNKEVRLLLIDAINNIFGDYKENRPLAAHRTPVCQTDKELFFQMNKKVVEIINDLQKLSEVKRLVTPSNSIVLVNDKVYKQFIEAMKLTNEASQKISDQ